MNAPGFMPDQGLAKPLKDKIDAFVEQAKFAECPLLAFSSVWSELVDDYSLLVNELKGVFEVVLGEKRIRATVSGRVKNLDSIQKSVRRREKLGDNFKDLDAIFKGIHDLAGLRIVADYPSGISEAEGLIQETFKKYKGIPFRSNEELGLQWKPIFGGFKSKNYRVSFWAPPDHPLARFTGVLIEIQVLSIAENLYNRLCHPLIYKEASGQLSVNDQRVIDISHGLSLCYWICLSCMEERLEGGAAQISNAVREVAKVEGNVDLSGLVRETPDLTSSRGGEVRIKDLLTFIHDKTDQEIVRPGELSKQLSQLASPVAQTVNSHSGSGHNITNNATTTNTFGPSAIHHGAVTYNYNRGDSTASDIYANRLLSRNPKDDKDEIQWRKGGLHDKSCDWIFENIEFRKWDQNPTPSILWVNGDPGKGKTMLVCRLINQLSPTTKLQNRSASTILSYFFCDANNLDQNDAASVLRGMIYLLIKQDDDAMACFRDEFEEKYPVCFEATPFTLPQLQRVFVRMLKALNSKSICLIIDALDECTGGQQQRGGHQALLELITGDAFLPHVRWIITSRNKPLIARFLQSCSTNISLEENEEAVSKAVTEYVTHRVRAMFVRENYSKEKAEEVERLLLSKAQSTFLWVALACQMVERDGTFDPIGALQKFPVGLDSLYGLMLKEVQSEALYQHIISVMLTVFRPVSLQELALLIPNFDETVIKDRMRKVVGSCGCFLTIRHSFVHFVHESAKEYLSNPTYYAKYDAQVQHHEILRGSLAIMSNLLKRDMFQQEKSVDRASASLRYPCTQWAFHLKKCKPEVMARELGEGSDLDKFLRQTYFHWLQALGYMGVTSDGILSMLELTGELVGRTCDFARLVREEGWFIRHHRRAIEESPSLIYAALVFIPSDHIIRKFYHEDPKWILLKPETEDWCSRATQSMEGHTDVVTDISLSYDSRLLVSASEDETLRVWDVATGESIHILSGHTKHLRSVTFAGSNYRIASACSSKIKIWNGKNGENINTVDIGQHTDATAHSVALSNNGDLVACIFSDNTVKLFNAETGYPISTFHDNPSKGGDRYSFNRHLAISPCGRFLASSNRHRALIWNMRGRGYPRRILLSFMNLDHPIKFSSKGGLWILNGDEAIFWDSSTEKVLEAREIREMICPDNVDFGNGQSSFASLPSPTTSFDKMVWDWLDQNYGTSNSILFPPTGNLLAATRGQQVKIWDLAIQDTTSPQWDKPTSSFFYSSVHISADGCFVAAEPNDELWSEEIPYTLWNLATGKVERTIGREHAESSPRALSISPSGKMIAYVQSLKVWVETLKTGANCPEIERAIQTSLSGWQESIAFSSDDTWLALAISGRVHIFEIQEGTEIRDLDTGHSTVNKLVFSGNNRYLACEFTDSITIWNTESWETETVLFIPERTQLEEPCGGGIVFSEDNSYLASSWHGELNDSRTRINIWKVFGDHDLQTFEIDIPCAIRSIDSKLSRIETSGGTFKLTHDVLYQRGYGLSEDQQWVLWDTERVLWLPPEFRPVERLTDMCHAVHDGDKIAIGVASGYVLCLKFDPDGPGQKTQDMSIRPLGSCSAPPLGRLLVPTKRRSD